jgi:hypothetical protein
LKPHRYNHLIKILNILYKKYKITGKKSDSGDTKNIGSFKSSDINHFHKGTGGFISNKNLRGIGEINSVMLS